MILVYSRSSELACCLFNILIFSFKRCFLINIKKNSMKVTYVRYKYIYLNFVFAYTCIESIFPRNYAGLQIVAELGQPCPSLYCAALNFCEGGRDCSCIQG